MTIKTKIILSLMIAAILPLFIVSSFSYLNARNELQRISLSNLEVVANMQVDKIEEFFKHLKLDIVIAQDYYNIQSNLPVVSELAKDRNNPLYKKAKEMLDSQLKSFQRVSGFDDVMLLNTDGLTVYASDKEHEASDLDNPLPDPGNKAFENGKKGIYFSDIFRNWSEGNDYSMVLTAPLKDFDGNLTGVIAFEIDMDPIYELIHDFTGMGETGETLIGKRVGDHALFLNPLRHDSDAALSRTAVFGTNTAFPIQEAVNGKSGSSVDEMDYRDVKVLAAWRYIPSMDWGLVAKIDIGEAFASIKKLRNFTITIGCGALMLAALFAVIIVRSITRPLNRLQEGILIIGDGNLDYKVGNGSRDEVGVLSKAFDQMTQKIKEVTASRDEVDLEIVRREQSETALRESEARTRAIVDSAIDGIITIDERGIVESLNPTAVKLFGYASEEVIGRNIKMLMPEPYQSEHDGYLRKYKNTGKANITGSSREVIGLRKDGATFPMTLGVSEVQLQNTKIFTGLIRDITEVKEAERELKKSHEQLVQSDKMSAVGNMVAGVAHELNNPMMGVLNFIQYCRKRIPEDDKKHGVLVDAEREIARCQEIVKNLLTFSRMEKEGEEGRSCANLDTILDRVIKLLSYHVSIMRVSINRHTDKWTPDVWIKTNSIQQVFLNLISNAIDAMDASDTRELNIDIRPEGELVQVMVSDTGPGIAGEDMQKIFEPFYTTKEVGKGTGLGLSMCRSIVMAHGGDITCESKAGEGTSFRILLPVDIRKEL